MNPILNVMNGNGMNGDGKTKGKKKDKKTKSEPGAHMISATQEMCFYCFDVLLHEFSYGSGRSSGSRKRKAPSPEQYTLPELECPLFVGWKKQSKRGNSLKLRGCKGTHGVLPLHEGLKQYSLLSAFDDTRFSEMRHDEVPRLTCSVSLLFAFEEAENCLEWEVGVHGIRIDFRDNNRRQRSATFLPHVAVQFGYTQRQTVERLVEKSGCNEILDEELIKRIKCIRFQGSDSYASYEEYMNRASNRKK